MRDLRSLYESIGFTGIETYIQSGNVIFNSEIEDVGRIEHMIQDAISKKYKFDVPIQVRTVPQLENIINNCPFGFLF